MKSKALLFLSIIFTLALGSDLLASSYGDTYGFSAEGISRGNAMTATVNDWSSVFYNMAGLGRSVDIGGGKGKGGEGMTLKLRGEGSESEGDDVKTNQFALSVLYTFPMMSINIARYDTSTTPATPLKTAQKDGFDPYGFIMIGGVLDINTIIKLPSFISTCRLGLGLGVNADGTLVHVNDLDPRTHDFLRYGREVQRAMILVGLGMGFMNDAFGFGIGANMAFGGQGKVEMAAAITNDPQVPPQQAKMDLGIAPGAVAGIYLSLGNIDALSVIKGLDIGASYRQETKMDIYPFDALAVVAGGILDMQMTLAIFDYYTPHTIIGGIAYTRWGLTISADIEYQMWSLYQVSKSREYNQDVYGPIVALQDIMVYKLGLKYNTPLNWLGVMAGYFYQPSIVPESSVKSLTNYLDNDKHVASLGFQFTVPKMSFMGGDFVVILGYQFQYLVERSVSKSNPADLLNPNYSYGGMNHSVVAEVGMKI